MFLWLRRCTATPFHAAAATVRRNKQKCKIFLIFYSSIKAWSKNIYHLCNLAFEDFFPDPSDPAVNLQLRQPFPFHWLETSFFRGFSWLNTPTRCCRDLVKILQHFSLASLASFASIASLAFIIVHTLLQSNMKFSGLIFGLSGISVPGGQVGYRRQVKMWKRKTSSHWIEKLFFHEHWRSNYQNPWDLGASSKLVFFSPKNIISDIKGRSCSNQPDGEETSEAFSLTSFHFSSTARNKTKMYFPLKFLCWNTRQSSDKLIIIW